MPKQKINMTLGRFQPFTQGHLNMVNEGEAPCIIYRINSSNKKIERKKKGIKIASKSWTDESVNKVISYIDNPTSDLTEQEKELLKRPFTNELVDKELEIVKKNNKNIIDIIPVVNMFDALDRFNAFCTEHSDEYEPQYWMCGDDRVDDYSQLIDKYDELETEFRSGKNLQNILKGKLKTNIGKGRTEGVSGTAVRKSILNKDKSSFEKIMPKGVGSMFNDFIKAFDEFKTQLQNIIKEHKMQSLKDYIRESLNDKSDIDKIMDSVLSRWHPNKRHESWISDVKDKLSKAVDDIDTYKKKYNITSSTKYEKVKDIANEIYKDITGEYYEQPVRGQYSKESLLIACLNDLIMNIKYKKI